MTDVTLRDGGYLNGHTWTDEQAHAVVRAVAACGVPRIEVGYTEGFVPDVRRTGEAPGNRGGGSPSAELLGALVDAASPATVLMMVKPFMRRPGLERPGRLRRGRGAFPAPRDPRRRGSSAAGRGSGGRAGGGRQPDPGQRPPLDLTVAAAVRATELGAQALYVADSNGSLTPDAVGELMRALHSSVPVPLGFHAHDNLRLAFANTLAALAAGAVHVDASFAGLGKGGGNLVLELLLGALRSAGRDDLMLRPLAPLAQILEAETAVKRSQEQGAWAAGLLDLDMERAVPVFDLPLDEVLAFVDSPAARR